MHIVFMGTPDFTLPILDRIEAAGHTISCVVTQPDRARGRGKEVSFSPAKEWALKRGIEVFQPERIRREENVEKVLSLKADICVVAAFGQILPKAVLEWPRYGCINVHASLLPKYRGAAPIQWSILNGDIKTGVTIMQMGEGLDDGDILLQKSCPIDDDITGGELFDKLAALGGEALVEALSAIERGEITPVPQNEAEATHVGMIDKSLGKVDFSMPASVIERYIRGLSPWPGTYVYMGGKTLKLWSADVLSQGDFPDAACGTLHRADDSGLYIQTGEGILKITEIQLEGKKRMPVADFLRGNKLTDGVLLGART